MSKENPTWRDAAKEVIGLIWLIAIFVFMATAIWQHHYTEATFWLLWLAVDELKEIKGKL